MASPISNLTQILQKEALQAKIFSKDYKNEINCKLAFFDFNVFSSDILIFQISIPDRGHGPIVQLLEVSLMPLQLLVFATIARHSEPR